MSSGATAYFESLGDGRFRATEHTEGPWTRESQHGGPPCGVLGRGAQTLFVRRTGG